ncbi:MAG: Hpt domain-containing protein, partial [Spirochaetia bacterium]|nr:Hpt domain-containing protein [Spirochaetia bacterium]
LGTDPEENKHIIQECFRSCHTLKGNARAMNLDTVSDSAHKLEDILAKVREHPETFTPEIKEQVVRGMHALQDEIQDGNSLFSKILNMKDALTVGHKDPEAEFQESVQSVVKKESTYAEKNVQLIYTKETPRKLSPAIVKRIRGPVIQLLRNAIDHGLEGSAARTKVGKPEAGTIRLTVGEEGGTLVVVCEDDGHGLSADTIKAKALEKKVITEDEAASMSTHDLYRLIFESGFSTAPRITELSGRGVGMDVIVGELKDLKGRIYVRTRPGEFTRFTLRIPDGFNEGGV